MTEGQVENLRLRLSSRSLSDWDEAPWRSFRSAAVLVPILLTPRGAEVLFTVRSHDLKSHAGQISFPGGSVEEGESLEQAAIREAYEEVGLTVPEHALVGRLSPRPSPARYLATPVVAILPQPTVLQPDPREVHEVFTLSLAQLAATQPIVEDRTLEGHRIPIAHFHLEQRHIWGLTGTALHELLALLADESVPA